jgi:hypothetical protein
MEYTEDYKVGQARGKDDISKESAAEDLQGLRRREGETTRRQGTSPMGTQSVILEGENGAQRGRPRIL